MRYTLIISVVLLIFAACGPRQRRAQVSDTEPSPVGEGAVITVGPKEIPRVDIPLYIDTPDQRIEYAVMHFWDKFDFSDTLYIATKTFEKAYGEYAFLLANAPDKEAARRSIGGIMKKAEPYPAMYDHLWDLADKYFYDPNSPVRDDEVYIGVLEAVIANPGLDELLKIAPREKLAIARMNRPGERANDFSYMTSTGSQGRLHDIEAEYTMIFFYNLGCQACREIREDVSLLMENEPGFGEFLRSGRLKVLAVYPDTEMEEWRKYMGEIPSDWINAYDPTPDNAIKRLYDMKAIPSLYLLDKNKRVILKDFTEPEKLYRALMQN